MSSLTAQIDGDRPTHHGVWCPRKSNIFRLSLAFFLLVVITFVVADHDGLKTLFLQYLKYMESHTFAGSVTFMFVSAISAVLLLPGSLLTFGAGFVYVHVFGLFRGVVIASLIVWFSACIGSTLSFLSGRYLLRGTVQYYTETSRKFALIEQIVNSNGLKVVFLLRLSPLIPFNVLNIFMGITSIRLRDFVGGHPGMIPETIICCFIGGSIANISTIFDGEGQSKGLLIIASIVGTLIAFSGILYISRMAKHEFNKLADQIAEEKRMADGAEEQLLLDSHEDREIQLSDLNPFAKHYDLEAELTADTTRYAMNVQGVTAAGSW